MIGVGYEDIRKMTRERELEQHEEEQEQEIHEQHEEEAPVDSGAVGGSASETIISALTTPSLSQQHTIPSQL
jgi:hypothetical protein